MKGQTRSKLVYRRPNKKVTPAIERVIDNKKIDFSKGAANLRGR